MNHQPLRAMLYFLAGLVLFAWMDTTIKYLSVQYPPQLVVAVRYVVHLLLMMAILAPSRGMEFARTQRTTLVVVRGACLAAASLFFALALKRLPVAEASAIIFAAPLLVMLMASVILKEQIGRWGWAAAIAGFCGLLLIARPGGHLDRLGVSFAAAAAVVLAIYQLMSRTLARTESTLALLFWTALIGAVAFGALAPWFWTGGQPTALQTVLFLSTGALAGLGHFLFTAAHRYAPASDLAPFQYIQLLWAGLFGYWTFGHIPDGLAILGMIVVAASGASVALKSQMAARAIVRAASA